MIKKSLKRIIAHEHIIYNTSINDNKNFNVQKAIPTCFLHIIENSKLIAPRTKTRLVHKCKIRKTNSNKFLQYCRRLNEDPLPSCFAIIISSILINEHIKTQQINIVLLPFNLGKARIVQSRYNFYYYMETYNFLTLKTFSLFRNHSQHFFI